MKTATTLLQEFIRATDRRTGKTASESAHVFVSAYQFTSDKERKANPTAYRYITEWKAQDEANPLNEAERMYNVFSRAVKTVLKDRYAKTGVPFYNELQMCESSDKRIFRARVNDELTTAEQEKDYADEIKEYAEKNYNKAFRLAVKLTASKRIRQAIAVNLLFAVAYRDRAREIAKECTKKISDIEKVLNKGYSDRFGLVQASAQGFYEWEHLSESEQLDELVKECEMYEELDDQEQNIVKYKVRQHYMCRAISKAMSELCNPAVDTVYRTDKVRHPTTGDYADFDAHADSKGRLWVRNDGRNKDYYTIKKYADRHYKNGTYTKGETWLLRHRNTVNPYQYSQDLLQTADGEEIDIDTLLTKATKDYTRFDSYFCNDLGDVEELLRLMIKGKFIAREQEFIKQVCKLYKTGTAERIIDVLDDIQVNEITDKAMTRIGLKTASAKRQFICRLRNRLSENGIGYKAIRKGKTWTYTSVTQDTGKADLLKWTETQYIIDRAYGKEYKPCIEWTVKGSREAEKQRRAEAYKQIELMSTCNAPTDERRALVRVISFQASTCYSKQDKILEDVTIEIPISHPIFKERQPHPQSRYITYNERTKIRNIYIILDI